MCSVKHNDITWALYYKMGGIAHFFCKLPKIKGFLRKISRVFAKVLALGLGGKKGPEVHGDGYYAHYHGYSHGYHIWYGGKVRY